MSTLLHLLAITSIKSGELPRGDAGTLAIKLILYTAFAVIGALALLIITVSGLRYILSGGDPQKTAKAKNGIVYSLVGLVIALSAVAIVSFVVKKL